MFTPLAQYAVQVVGHDTLAEAQAAKRRRQAREARHAEKVRQLDARRTSGGRRVTGVAAADAS